MISRFVAGESHGFIIGYVCHSTIPAFGMCQPTNQPFSRCFFAPPVRLRDRDFLPPPAAVSWTAAEGAPCPAPAAHGRINGCCMHMPACVNCSGGRVKTDPGSRRHGQKQQLAHLFSLSLSLQTTMCHATALPHAKFCRCWNEKLLRRAHQGLAGSSSCFCSAKHFVCICKLIEVWLPVVLF